jgi:glycosyltransferase involved in cell wall biosynthesis
LKQNNKIKVLFISSWYPNRVRPTLGNFVQKHAEAVSLYAYVTVLHVCFDDNLYDKNLEIVSTEINSIKTLYIYCKKSGNILIRFCRYLNAYSNGIKMVTKQQGTPDIIHANILFPVGLVFYFLNSFKKNPFVISEHWTGYLPDDHTKIGFIQKYFSKKIVSKASMVLPVSEDLKNAMIALGFHGIYKVLPNVVDTKLFSIVQKKNTSIKNILHVSSFVDAHKNISGILRVIKKLSEIRQDFSLHFISDGNQEPFIVQAKNMRLLNRYVFFHGEKKTHEVAKMMQQSDFLLLFSNYENFPCVIAEAYSCGLPVISTDVGGISEHLTDKHGIIIKQKDEEALLHAINKMLDNVGTYDKIFLHEYALNNFSYESVGKKIIDVYSEILNG